VLGATGSEKGFTFKYLDKVEMPLRQARVRESSGPTEKYYLIFYMLCRLPTPGPGMAQTTLT
jgi:hypothetical protein